MSSAVLVADDKLFSAVVTHEDENGNLTLFSRRGVRRVGTPLGAHKNRAIKTLAIRVLGKDTVADRVVIVPGPDGLPAKVREQMAENAITAQEVRGVHWAPQTYCPGCWVSNWQPSSRSSTLNGEPLVLHHGGPTVD